ncbi:MAG: hypothetical protein ACO3N7_10525, partial [Kiritimatiellia bacterium]
MNSRCVFHLVSYLIMFVSLAMGSCTLISWAYGDGLHVILQMLSAAGISFLLGFGMFYLTRGPVTLTRKD